MNWICRLSIRFPRSIILLGVIVTLACAPGILHLTLRTDGNALVPRGAPELIEDRQVRDHFGVEDLIVICIESPDPEGIYNVHTLDMVRRLNGMLPSIEGIEPEHLASLATEKQDRVYTGSLRFKPFLEPFPDNPIDMKRLREAVDLLDLYLGTLVSYDYKSTAIILSTAPDLDRSRLVRDIYGLIDGLGDIPERITVLGAPVAESLLGVHVLEDLGVLDILAAVRTLLSEHFGWQILPDMHELDLTSRGTEPWPQLMGALLRPLPVAIAAIAVILLIVCRNFWGMFLPMVEIVACLLATFGLMGTFGVPFYLTMAVLPVILTAIGIADEIHIFARYRQELNSTTPGTHIDPVKTTMNEMWRPVVKTSVTSCIGFLSFSLSPLEPVRMFGIFTAVGIFFCMMWSLMVIPACLALLKPARFQTNEASLKRGEHAAESSRLWAATGVVLKARRPILILAAALVAIAPLGIRRLYVQDSWIDGFSRRSEFYQATQRFNEGFRGTHMLYFAVTGGPLLTAEIPAADLYPFSVFLPSDYARLGVKQFMGASLRPDASRSEAFTIVNVDLKGEKIRLDVSREGGRMVQSHAANSETPIRVAVDVREGRMHDAELIRRIGRFEDMIAEQPTVGSVLGPEDHLSLTHFMLRQRMPEFRCIPDDPVRLNNLVAYYVRNRGAQRLHELFGDDHQQALISVFLKNANFQDTARLLEAVEAYRVAELEPYGIEVRRAGDVAVSQTMIPAIVETQKTSLLLSLCGVFMVSTVLFGSLTAGMFCVLPPALAVFLNYAMMGFLDIPLGVATSMFCGMTLGIGVDYAIHLIERCRISFARRGSVPEGIRDAVSFAGPAIIFDAAAIAIGFGVLTLSQVPANSRLGLLLVISVCSCLLATLVVLPVLLSLWRPWFLRRALRRAPADSPGQPQASPSNSG